MKRMKKISMVSFFVFYQFFVSFIINCGEDLPYDLINATGEDTDTEGDCDGNTFLTADCVDEVEADLDEAEPADAGDADTGADDADAGNEDEDEVDS